MFHLTNVYKHELFEPSFSYHMTLHIEWFTTFKSNNFGFVYLIDDKACSITRMGYIEITIDDRGALTFNDVRYIQKMRHKLISLGTLQANGFSYKSDGYRDILKVSKGELTMMRTNRIIQTIGLYGSRCCCVS